MWYFFLPNIETWGLRGGQLTKGAAGLLLLSYDCGGCIGPLRPPFFNISKRAGYEIERRGEWEGDSRVCLAKSTDHCISFIFLQGLFFVFIKNMRKAFLFLTFIELACRKYRTWIWYVHIINSTAKSVERNSELFVWHRDIFALYYFVAITIIMNACN